LLVAAETEPAAASKMLASTTRATRRPPGTEIDTFCDMAFLALRSGWHLGHRAGRYKGFAALS
jgi:hypothetical protein